MNQKITKDKKIATGLHILGDESNSIFGDFVSGYFATEEIAKYPLFCPKYNLGARKQVFNINQRPVGRGR